MCPVHGDRIPTSATAWSGPEEQSVPEAPGLDVPKAIGLGILEVESCTPPSPRSWRNSHVVVGQDSGSVLPRLRGLTSHPTPLGRPQPSSLAELDSAFHHLCRAGGGSPYRRWKKPKEARGEGGVMGRKGKENRK